MHQTGLHAEVASITGLPLVTPRVFVAREKKPTLEASEPPRPTA